MSRNVFGLSTANLLIIVNSRLFPLSRTLAANDFISLSASGARKTSVLFAAVDQVFNYDFPEAIFIQN